MSICPQNAKWVAVFAILSCTTAASAERIEPLPKELEGVGIDEKLGQKIPRNLRFRDENGNEVTLGKILGEGRPTILTLNYFSCPMLCSIQLRGLIESLGKLKWTVGKEYQVVTVSLDPRESPERVTSTKERYLAEYGRPDAGAGWHFLTADDATIHALADAVGFRYRYSQERKEYLHVPALILLTGGGRVSRYLYGIVYDSRTVRLSLLEAAEGKMSTTLDRLILYCFHYDASSGRYAPMAENIMRLGGATMVVLVAIGLGLAFGREARRRRSRGTRGGGGGMVAILAMNDGGFWFPAPASQLAPQVDSVFNFILWTATVFFAAIVGLLVVFVIKYRRRRGVAAAKTATHSPKLELVWSIVPGAILVVMFYLGLVTYLEMRTPPKDAYEIQVTAQKWSWSFTYPNGHTDPELHVPANQPVRLVMTSEDVIHSFFVPAFRVKMDVVPGRYTHAWFVANEPGTYYVTCAEYCGTQHSQMRAKVVVHAPGEFETWLEKSASALTGLPPAKAGEKLYQSQGCQGCHSTDGSQGTGPSWKGVFGKPVTFADGKRGVVDENYLRESILDPQAKVVQGFAPVMPTYKGRLKDNEISAIVEYIKSLK